MVCPLPTALHRLRAPRRTLVLLALAALLGACADDPGGGGADGHTVQEASVRDGRVGEGAPGDGGLGGDGLADAPSSDAAPAHDAAPSYDAAPSSDAALAKDGASTPDSAPAADSAPAVDSAPTPDSGPCGPGGCAKTATIEIDVSNSCAMTVVPSSVTVPAGQTINLTYHNKSAWYAVDIWQSYGGGFLDLPPGQSWVEKFTWCATPNPYTGYADISTACSSHRLLIHCL